MRDTSFVAFPIRTNAFFQQAVLECQIGDAFLQGTGFAPQVLHFAGGCGTGGVAGEAALALRFSMMPRIICAASVHELLGPGVIQALSNALLG
jgi:hypothetical protein